MALLESLLNTNFDVLKHSDSRIFHCACWCLRNELGIAVLSLFYNKDKYSTGVKSVDINCSLPIHIAAYDSSLDVLKYLYVAYPESISMVTNSENTLLHQVYGTGCKDRRKFRNDKDRKEKVEYLCEHFPSFIHQKNEDGGTPLLQYITTLVIRKKPDMKPIICLCHSDETVVRDICTPSIDNKHFEQLPLHLLMEYAPPSSELSDEKDCFCLFLRLYPASAGIKDGHLISLYDLAVLRNLSVCFIRLLLNADPTIDPVKRHNMNFAARRNGMFLAFRALSGNLKPTIWAKIRYEGKDLLPRVISYL
jgi:hypothetical protein